MNDDQGNKIARDSTATNRKIVYIAGKPIPLFELRLSLRLAGPHLKKKLCNPCITKSERSFDLITI